MAHLFALCKVVGGQPDLGTAVANYVYCGGTKEGMGAYLFSGTDAQVAAVAGLANVVPIVTATDEKTTVDKDGKTVVTPRWSELDAKLSAAAKTALDTKLSAAKASVALSTQDTYRAVIGKVFAQANPRYDLAAYYVADVDAKAAVAGEIKGDPAPLPK